MDDSGRLTQREQKRKEQQSMLQAPMGLLECPQALQLNPSRYGFVGSVDPWRCFSAVAGGSTAAMFRSFRGKRQGTTKEDHDYSQAICRWSQQVTHGWGPEMVSKGTTVCVHKCCPRYWREDSAIAEENRILDYDRRDRSRHMIMTYATYSTYCRLFRRSTSARNCRRRNFRLRAVCRRQLLDAKFRPRMLTVDSTTHVHTQL
jgi:hypothetical protein